MISVRQKGDFTKTEKFLKKSFPFIYRKILERYARQGVEALSAATPRETGRTAASWYYTIDINDDGCTIEWNNGNVNRGVNIAMILQYGHGTRNGGYVSGRDYINPALRPLFDKMTHDAWEEVTKV